MGKIDRFLVKHDKIVKITIITLAILFVLAFFYVVWSFNSTELLIKN